MQRVLVIAHTHLLIMAAARHLAEINELLAVEYGTEHEITLDLADPRFEPRDFVLPSPKEERMGAMPALRAGVWKQEQARAPRPRDMYRKRKGGA